MPAFRSAGPIAEVVGVHPIYRPRCIRRSIGRRWREPSGSRPGTSALVAMAGRLTRVTNNLRSAPNTVCWNA